MSLLIRHSLYECHFYCSSAVTIGIFGRDGIIRMNDELGKRTPVTDLRVSKVLGQPNEMEMRLCIKPGTGSFEIYITSSATLDEQWTSGFLPIYSEEQILLDEGEDIRQSAFSTLSALAEDKQVVRIADKSMSSAFQLLVQLVQHNVTKYLTQISPLRHSDSRFFKFVLHNDASRSGLSPIS